MENNYKKIRIIGCSGSGKTYLSKYLGNKYKIPSFDLDTIVWDNSEFYGIKNDKIKRSLLFSNILENKSWIIEGIYYNKWVKQTFDDADIIYVLNIPAYICIYRVIKRFIKRKLHKENGKKESLKSLISLICWIYNYNRKEFPTISLVLKEHSEKVIYLNKKTAELI